MTYVLDALRELPVGLFQMDDSSPVQDYSGYNRVATITGTPVQHPSLVKGAVYAPVFSRSATCQYDSPVFNQGAEGESFTLGAWVYPIQQTKGITQTYQNINLNPSVESNASGATSSSNGTLYATSNDTAIFRRHTRSLRTDRTATTPSGTISQVNLTPTSQTNTLRTVVNAGQIVSASMQVRASVACRSRINMVCRDAAGASLATLTGAFVNLSANTWTLVTFENQTMPANTTYVSIQGLVSTSSGNTVSGEIAWFDEIMVNIGAAVKPYVDGDMAGATWDGAQHASTSTMLISSSEQKILSHANDNDGLTVNGTVVSFSTKYLTSGEARAQYDLQTLRSVSLFGVHTSDKNMLYVDGELVAEVDITEAQQADLFVVTTANLFSGATTSSQGVAINGVGIFSKALSSETIARLHAQGRAVPDGSAVVENSIGDWIPLSLNYSSSFTEHVWTNPEDWSSGVPVDVNVFDDRLIPQFDDSDTSMAGYWYTSFPLDAGGLTSLQSAWISYESFGSVIVETSLDGTTWTTAPRSGAVAGITGPINPTDILLQIRVGFTGGIVDDQSYVDNLSLALIDSATPESPNGRTLTFGTNDIPKEPHDPLEYHDNWGALLAAGQPLTISADLDGTPARTIGVWVKPLDSSVSISMTGTAYQNGSANASALPVNQWTLYHVVASADVTGTITIDGNAEVGQIAIYDYALSATEVANNYAAYTGTNQVKINDSSVVTVSESASAAQIYAHDWSITGAG